jgi:t-SNARE complex subunit (syntaxin)
MDAVNKGLQKKDPNGNDTTIRVSQHGVLTKNFLEVMTEYKKLQETYQSKFKDRMQRQALIGKKVDLILTLRSVKPNATKEEIEKMVDGEQGQLFAKQVFLNIFELMEDCKFWTTYGSEKSIRRYPKQTPRCHEN